MSWTTTTLGEVTDLKRGFDLPASKRVSGKYPVYSSSGKTGTHDKYMVEGPCVITGRYGTIGKVFYSSNSCWPLNTSLYSCDFNGNNPRFVYYLLQTIPWSEYTTASAVPGVNRNHVNLHKVTIPDKITQDRIAYLLDSITSKIELNSRINGYLGTLCESIAAKACSKPDGALSDICIQVTDKTSFDSTDIETYVSTESLLQNKGGRQTASSLPAAGKVTCYRRGDTLVSNIRPYFKKIWFASNDGTCSGDVLVFRANEVSNAAYLYSCLRQDSFFDHVMRGAKGTKMPRGDKKQVMNFPIAFRCDESDLAVLNSVVEQMAMNDAKSARLAELCDALLPKLMSGEIDVSKVDLTQLNSHLSDC